ncbi:hypothetical protein DOTSEDRAFT_71503 [Dothistroma septosporum NZE10]|uniref:Uncharacterized protein n=1 Tax=Dothistroma septosporum (strain NZE10 / CBS 128990) TaxID=675120 RepID=N1PTZ5_DOTSN|nr:hypothetical protein DOTSEDRAFT_71503 [Dothistroma septosporum NZE10]
MTYQRPPHPYTGNWATEQLFENDDDLDVVAKFDRAAGLEDLENAAEGKFPLSTPYTPRSVPARPPSTSFASISTLVFSQSLRRSKWPTTSTRSNPATSLPTVIPASFSALVPCHSAAPPSSH